ncbi:MAG: hypothetical protein ACRDHY_07250 [Anaerolineales bacterium]
MIEAVVAILSGLLLLSPILRRGSAGGTAVRGLAPFETVVGVIALVIGMINILSVLGLVLIAAGLVLAVGAVAQVPGVGPSLRRAGLWLAQFRILLGLLVLVMGVVALAGPLGRGLGGGPPGPP